MTTLEITAPDDLHLHVRDGNMLKAVLPHTTRIFRRSGVRMHRGSVGVGVCTRVHSAPSAPSPPRVRRRARFVRIFPGPAGRATRAHASACVCIHVRTHAHACGMRSRVCLRDKRVRACAQTRTCRAIIMPNLVPPVSTLEMAKAYKERVMAAVPPGDEFEPLMTLYLTHNTTPDDIKAAGAAALHACGAHWRAGARERKQRQQTERRGWGAGEGGGGRKRSTLCV